jgi:hypothetical protein
MCAAAAPHWGVGFVGICRSKLEKLAEKRDNTKKFEFQAEVDLQTSTNAAAQQHVGMHV